MMVCLTNTTIWTNQQLKQITEKKKVVYKPKNLHQLSQKFLKFLNLTCNQKTEVFVNIIPPIKEYNKHNVLNLQTKNDWNLRCGFYDETKVPNQEGENAVHWFVWIVAIRHPNVLLHFQFVLFHSSQFREGAWQLSSRVIH